MEIFCILKKAQFFGQKWVKFHKVVLIQNGHTFGFLDLKY